MEPDEITFDEGATFRVTVVSAWPGVPGLVLMLTAGASVQDAALADTDFILEADELVLIVGTTEFSFDDATLSHSDTTGDNGEYTGVVIATWTEGEPGLAAGETVAFLLEHRDRPEEAQFSQHDSEVQISLDWSLILDGVGPGEKFRLLFVTDTERAADSTDIDVYNTYVQGRAAAGHADIQDYSSQFRVVGCTSAVNAIENTDTSGIGLGISIYWLNGIGSRTTTTTSTTPSGTKERRGGNRTAQFLHLTGPLIAYGRAAGTPERTP